MATLILRFGLKITRGSELQGFVEVCEEAQLSDNVLKPMAIAPLDVRVDANLADCDSLVHFDLGHDVLFPPDFHDPVEGVDVGSAHAGELHRTRDTLSVVFCV